MPQVLLPVVPESITVHLGAPDEDAENLTVPYTEYVKNVASSEIYPTWPEAALTANILAITSYALNRVYTEYYRANGYDFDITSLPAFDQAFIKNRDIYENISRIVDRVFNNYIVRRGFTEPLAAKFCNGTTSQCDGLSQWGSVSLAEEGYSAFQILERFYGSDIELVENAPVEEVTESYPGIPLSLGDASNDIRIIQVQLNRIALNYPAIPEIKNENGIFGVDTQNAVRTFQQIFSLADTGIVDKATWYKIKRYYNGVKSLAELVSEGVEIDEITLPFEDIGEGAEGLEVEAVQYYLEFLSYFNPEIPTVAKTGVYDAETVAAVKAFEQINGLPQTGIVREQTLLKMRDVYRETVASLPVGYSDPNAKYYPGFFISEGMSGTEVSDLQKYLYTLGKAYPELYEVPLTGYFGPQTREAVERFQELFGLYVNGAVGPLTWNSIAREYNHLVAENSAAAAD